MEVQEFEKFLKDFHKELASFIRTFPELEEYTPFLKMDWSKRRVCNRGGWYKKGEGVNYAMHRLKWEAESGTLIEYASFEKDPYIGTFSTENWKLIVKAVSCHEQAHAICGFLDKDNSANHGEKWKKWYRILRDQFVNNEIRKSRKSKKNN